MTCGRSLTRYVMGPAIAGLALAGLLGCGSGPEESKATGRILFRKRGSPRPFAMRPDGSQVEKLSIGPCRMSWSRDFRQMARLEGDMLYVLRDGRWEFIGAEVENHTQEPSFSPDGTKLLFAKKQKHWGALYVLDLASGRATQLTRDEPMGYPVWSADGRRIYFCGIQRREGTESGWKGGFYSVDPATGIRELVTDEDGDGCNHRRVAPLPDGRLVLQLTDPADGFNPQLWLMGGDGTGRQRIGQFVGNSVHVSPDGGTIGFVEFDGPSGRNYRACLITPEGKVVQRMRPYSGFNRWSPDGRFFIYDVTRVSLAGMKPTWFVSDLAGDRRWQLPEDTAVVHAWIPDEAYGPWLHAAAPAK